MHVTDITISGTEYHPGDSMYVEARIQKDYLDLGPYDLAMYVKKKTAPSYAWERVGSATGNIGLFTSSAVIPMPSFTVPSTPGEYYVGVLDTGNIGGKYGATVDEVLRHFGAYRSFTVTLPPPAGMAQLNVYTYPEDASIYINGEKMGTGSVVGYNVTPGIYKIAAKKALYRDASTMVTVGQGEVIPVELTLEPYIDSTVILYAGAGLLLAGVAYVIINRRAREKAISAGKAVYAAGGELYHKVGDAYVKVRDA